MLIDVARLFTDAPWSTPQPDPLVARVFGVIEARFAEGISLADVARAVDRSPAHLTSHVRRATGCTVVGWIVERRMLEARRLLAETSLTVAEIGRAVGYDNRAYFVRLFGRVHGVPPLAWRRGNHQGIVESER
jgi:AraC-like DNA-binding protein